MKKASLLLPVLLIGTLCFAQRSAMSVSEELLTAFSPKTATIDSRPVLYRETLVHPEKADSAALVIFLHSAGGRGDDNLSPLGMPAVQSIYDYLTANGQKAYILVPQCPRTASWNGIAPGVGRQADSSGRHRPATKGDGMTLENATPYVRCLMPLIKDFAGSHPVDPSRIYILGASMGAAGVWEIIADNPDFFAAGMAVSGAYRGYNIMNLTATPIVCAVGTEENTFDMNRRITERLNALGADAVFIPLDGLRHVQACNTAFTPENLDLVFSKTR